MPGDNTGINVGWLAGRYPGQVGHLYSPRPRRNPSGPFEYLPFALDNGSFAGGESWDQSRWLALLDWAKLSGFRPLWALVPDVVGDRSGTLRRWNSYAPRLSEYGWPLGFAVQDGMTPNDVPSQATVVFVGGSTRWKWRSLQTWCKEFRRVHVGRVNSYRRLWECHDAGAESCDGTGWFRGDHGSGRPWHGLLAYFEEATGRRPRPQQMTLIA
jgi:hypothetical protein